MMEEQRPINKLTLADILNGSIFESAVFVRNKLFLFVIFLMLVATISVRYKTAKVLREVDTLEREVKELRAHSIALSADIIRLTRPSEILDRIRNSNLGLEPSREPPRRLYVDKQ